MPPVKHAGVQAANVRLRVSARMEGKFIHQRELVIKYLRIVHADGAMKYSSGAIGRATGIPPRVIQSWRRDEGIPDLPAGKCRPTPDVGQILD